MQKCSVVSYGWNIQYSGCDHRVGFLGELAFVAAFSRLVRPGWSIAFPCGLLVDVISEYVVDAYLLRL